MARSIGLKDKVITSERQLDSDMLAGTRKTWSCTYLVLTSSTSETDEDVMAASGIPPLRSFANNGWLHRKEANEVDASAGLWEVNCYYDSHVEQDQAVVTYTWDVEEREELCDYDAVTGKPIMNSAREKLMLTMMNSIPVLSVTRMESFFSPLTILRYNNRVNADVFLGAPPFCALMTGPVARQVVLNGARVWEVTYRIKFNLRVQPKPVWDEEEDETVLVPHMAGWIAWLLDEGTFYNYTDDDGNIVSGAFTIDGEPVRGNLDGTGKPLPILQPEVYLPFNRYAVARFNLLGLV